MSNYREDAEYLKSEEVGCVIAKGMAVTYRADPKNPIDFFAKWLLNHSRVQRQQIQQEDKQLKQKELQEKFDFEEKQRQKEREKVEAELQAKKDDADRFQNKIKSSKDLSDELDTLVSHLQVNTGSTAVYIGKIVKPIKEIKDDSNDTEHIDPNAAEQIQFMHASGDHEFLVDKILKQEDGITYQELFATPDPEPENPEDVDPNAPVPEKLPKFIFRDEVVREDKMHYFNVPRLGSYMAIKLEYASCLSIEAFDAALADCLEVQVKQAAQNQEKADWETAQEEAKQAALDEEKEFVPEEKTWDPIVAKPFVTSKVQYVVCLNTMGKDVKYTEDQKMFALRTVQKFRDRWEELEKENLQRDVDSKIARSDRDKAYLANDRERDQVELDRIVDDAVANVAPAEGEEAISEDQKALTGIKTRFLRATTTFYAPNQAAQHKAKMDRIQKEKLRSASGNRSKSGLGSEANQSAYDDKSQVGSTKEYIPLVPEQWKDALKDFREHSVVKFPRIWQSLIYLLKFKERPKICDRDTNKLSWKKTKAFLKDDDLFAKMSEYWPFGPKDESYKEYERLLFVKGNLDGITEEAVDEYSVALGKLLRWVHLAIDTRTEDLRMRRNQKANDRKKRQEAQDKEKERLEKREQQREEAKAAFDQKIADEVAARAAEQEGDGVPDDDDMPEFDAEEFYAKFDDENLPIDIPDEVEDDVDNDFNIEIQDKPEPTDD